jgi:uncharacterized protein YndB with AHSA1/START domain
MPVPSAAIRRKTAARTGGSRGKRVTSTRTRALLTYAAGAGPREIADKFSATYQVAVAARTIREVAELAERARDAGKRLTTLTLDTEVRFATPGEREAFANELVEAVTRLAREVPPRRGRWRPHVPRICGRASRDGRREKGVEMSREIRKEVLVDAPPDVVWRALTEADQLSQWFPIDARIEPGKGGKVWISWGPDMEGTAPISEWEPNRRFGWQEDRGPVKLAIDFHLEARGGQTIVRLVQSGFGEGASWDDEYHTLEGGWAYFLAHLVWYLQRHRNTRRRVIAFREAVTAARSEALTRLIGPNGLFERGSLASANPGETFRDTTASGDAVTGTVLSKSPATGQMGLTIGELNDAILFLEMEPHATGARAGFWLSTYGLDPAKLIATGQLYERLYRQALGLTPAPAARV